MMERYKLEMQKMYEDKAGRGLQREERLPPPAENFARTGELEELSGTGEPAAEPEDRTFVVTDEIPETVPERPPERFTGRTPDIVPERTPERFAGRTPDMVPERAPERFAGRTPDIVPERTPERFMGRTPDMVPERTPERFRERTPEEFPDFPPKMAEEKEISFGKIIVSTVSGRGAYPLAGVSVVIDRTDENDPAGRQQLIASLSTNESGKTRPVPVLAVSREYSLEPGNGAPFSTYYVTAVYEGYIPVRRRPVDVFGGETSLLELELIPKPEGED